MAVFGALFPTTHFLVSFLSFLTTPLRVHGQYRVMLPATNVKANYFFMINTANGTANIPPVFSSATRWLEWTIASFYRLTLPRKTLQKNSTNINLLTPYPLPWIDAPAYEFTTKPAPRSIKATTRSLPPSSFRPSRRLC